MRTIARADIQPHVSITAALAGVSCQVFLFVDYTSNVQYRAQNYLLLDLTLSKFISVHTTYGVNLCSLVLIRVRK